jgi:hypothetical protein
MDKTALQSLANQGMVNSFGLTIDDQLGCQDERLIHA